MLSRVSRQQAARQYVSQYHYRRVLAVTELSSIPKLGPVLVKTATPYPSRRDYISKAATDDNVSAKHKSTEPTAVSNPDGSHGGVATSDRSGASSSNPTPTTTGTSSRFLIPTGLQSNHDSLSTFLTHATHTDTSRTSTTYLGTRYEYLIQEHLTTHLKFNLTRIGGRGDSGIDLLGTWNLPSILPTSSSGITATPPPPIPVLIQCKRLTTKRTSAGPNLIRELEGSFRSAPSEWRSPSTLGILVCSQPATKGVRDAMARSGRGLMWCCIEEEEELEKPQNEDADQDEKIPKTRVRQILWNSAAALHSGLEGVDVGMKYIGKDIDERSDREVILLWKGREINFKSGI